MAFVCVINRLLAEADVRERATQKNPDGVSCTPPSPATRLFQETGPSFPIYTLRPTQIELLHITPNLNRYWCNFVYNSLMCISGLSVTTLEMISASSSVETMC